jgi:hypothetical protein
MSGLKRRATPTGSSLAWAATPILANRPLVAQPGQAVPDSRAVRAEQLGGRGDDDGVGAFHGQAAQAGAGLGLDEVGTAVGAGGRQGDAERHGTRDQVAQHLLGAAVVARHVQHRQAGAGGDGEDVAGFGFGRAGARRRAHAVQSELGGGETELGNRKRHGNPCGRNTS